MSDYQRSRDFYAAVAANLLAQDIQARVVSNARACLIEVRLIDGVRVIWSSGVDGEHWAYTFVRPEGDVEAGQEALAWDSPVEEVARLIADYPYVAGPEFPIEHPGDEA